jgi:hypothetical protein
MCKTAGFAHVVSAPIHRPTTTYSGLVIARRNRSIPAHLPETLAYASYHGRIMPRVNGVLRIPVLGRLGPFESEDEQMENCCSQDVSLEPGVIYDGPELIANVGFKLVSEIPQGGRVLFEIDDGTAATISLPIDYERAPLDLKQSVFHADEMFPRCASAGDWRHHHWGSWGDLGERGGRLVFRSSPDMGIDANHADGIGPLDLMLYSFPSADLRDATVEFELRGLQYEPGDAEVFLFCQSEIKSDRSDTPFATTYCLSSAPLTQYLEDGNWHSFTVALSNRPELWSFAGSAFADLAKGSRYGYRSLNDALSRALNLFLVGCYPKSVPNFFNKRDATRYGIRPSGGLELRRFRLSRASGAKRFASHDHMLTAGCRTAKYRTHVVDLHGNLTVSPWRSVSLPVDRRPTVTNLTVDSAGGKIAGRINAMGLRTWCWLETKADPQAQLYLGATKHGRDFTYRFAAGARGRFVVANEIGSQQFEV